MVSSESALVLREKRLRVAHSFQLAGWVKGAGLGYSGAVSGESPRFTGFYPRPNIPSALELGVSYSLWGSRVIVFRKTSHLL